MEKCKKHTTTLVWWPGVMHQITQLVQNCRVCAKESRQGKELLMTPKYLWQVVGTDLFELNKSNYLLVVDYFSKYPEVLQLTSTMSYPLWSLCSRDMGCPRLSRAITDHNTLQQSSWVSQAHNYGFQHLTSSPKFPQSNGQAEQSVQTIKNLLKKSDDLHTSLLSFRVTPVVLRCDLSPAELSMGRRLRTSVPQTDKMLIPQWSYLKTFRELNRNQKSKQKENFDLRHRAKDLPAIPDDTEVWITTDSGPVSGRVISPTDRPRSYVVETPSGQIERNQSQLTVALRENLETNHQPQTETETSRRIMMRSRTGTAINPPDRL